MATSTSKGFPYPQPTDPANVPSDVEALASLVDAHAWGGYFTTTQRDLLVAPGLWAGMVIWNSTTSQLEVNATGTAGSANWAPAKGYVPPADQSAATPSLRTLGTSATQAAAGNDPRLSDQRTPLDGSVTDTKVASANKDGAAGTPSMRTLGTGAQQAAAGNHGHSDLAPLASPTFTGDPKAPTPATTDNDTSIATTAFVQAFLASGVVVAADGSSGSIDIGPARIQWGMIGATFTGGSTAGNTLTFNLPFAKPPILIGNSQSSGSAGIIISAYSVTTTTAYVTASTGSGAAGSGTVPIVWVAIGRKP